MTVTIAPMPDPVIDRREDVFAALITKEVRKIVRQISAELRGQPLTAAAEPAPAITPTPLPLAAAEAQTLASWQVFVETTAFPFVVDSMVDSAGLVVEQMASATGLLIEPITNEFASQYLQSARNRMVNVGQGLWQDIRKELVAGSEAGEGIPEIAARLTQFPQVSEYRARMVARTEVISALNAGSYLQMIEYDLGTDVKKEWLATEDQRTRLGHKHADNQSVLLVDEFTVGIYSDAVKIGEEGMEFPGDPTASAGNVINCRCTLGFTFDEDDVLTAAGGDFIEAEHPRDKEGKFAKKLGVSLPDLDKLTDNQYKAFVKGLNQTTWNKYSKDQQDSIIKRSGKLGAGPSEDATIDKLFTLYKEGKNAKQDDEVDTDVPAAPAKKTRPLGGIDNTSGKPTKQGKPVMLRVKALFGTTYENGAIVAVKPDTNERIIWEDKKMVRQVKLPGSADWTTTETLTRGAMMQKYKDEEGWFTPSPDNLGPAIAPVKTGNPVLDDILAQIPTAGEAAAPAPAVSAPATGKPIKLKVNVLYNKKYADGDVVAVRPFSAERIVWNGKTNKLDRQFQTVDGWVTAESLTRGAAYAKYKEEDGWFTPGDGTSTLGETPKVAPEPSESVLPDQSVSTKYPINNYKGFVDNPSVKVGKLIDTIGDDDEITVRKGPNGTVEFYAYEAGSKKISLDAATLTDEKIDNAIAELSSQQEAAQAKAQAPIGKYNVSALKTALIDSSIPTGEKLLIESGPDGTKFRIRKSGNKRIRLEHIDSDGSGLAPDEFLLLDEISDDAIDNIFNSFTSSYLLATKPVAQAPPALKVDPPKPFKFSADAMIGKTSTTYTPGQIIAEWTHESGAQARILWNGKKYQVQARGNAYVAWEDVYLYNKQAAYKAFKGKPGWVTPSTQKHDTTGITPSVQGDPVPVNYTSPTSPEVKKPKVTVAQLLAEADKHTLTELQSANLYKAFRNPPGMGMTLTTSDPEQIFKALVHAQRKHNNENPGNQVTLLQALRAIDEQGTAAAPAGTVNQHLYEKKVVAWQSTPSGMKKAQSIFAELSMTAEEKAAKAAEELAAAKAKAAKAYTEFTKIPVSAPAPKQGDVYEPLTDFQANALQSQNIPINDLPKAQRDALQNYKNSQATYNAFLRSFGAQYNDPHTVTTVENMQKAMRPMPKPVLLYRNVNSVFSATFTPTLEQLKSIVGKRMTEDGFASTSIDPNVFSGRSYRFNIQVPAGTPAAYVQHLGSKSHPSEKEWILGAGLHFEILDATKVGSTIVIDIKVVP